MNGTRNGPTACRAMMGRTATNISCRGMSFGATDFIKNEAGPKPRSTAADATIGTRQRIGCRQAHGVSSELNRAAREPWPGAQLMH